MNTDLLHECVNASFSGTQPFGEIVTRLAQDGVEWYSSNLIEGVTTHYGANGEFHRVAWPSWEAPAISEMFSASGVIEAIRASQRGAIKYPVFLEMIAAAGIAYYTVHMKGRKAIYFAPQGDQHVELFPQ